MHRAFLLILLSVGLLIAQGNAIFRVTDFPGHELCPRVSPDGERLAYTDVNLSGPFPVAHLRVASHEGQNPMFATDRGVDNQYPAWYPNGIQLTYERLVAFTPTDSSYEIWAVPINGVNGAKLIQNNYNFSVMPDISVNGDAAFVTSENINSPFPSFPPLKYGFVPPPAAIMGNFIIAIQPAGQLVVLNTIP